MSSQRGQKIFIWAMAIVMALGTVVSFVVIIFANENNRTDQAQQQQQQAEYQQAVEEYQQKTEEQAAELSKKYYGEFSKYADRPVEFDADGVNKLETRDLKVGVGEEITADTEYNAYYIGWNPDGEVFDQSIENGALRSPIPGGNLIEGWNEGVKGMKIGGIREISIPASMAYGESGAGELIGPNTPIKFVVMVIPPVEPVPFPDFGTFVN